MSFVKWLVRRAAEKLDVFDVADYPSMVRVGPFLYVKVPLAEARDVKLPTENPFLDEAAQEYRRGTALMLLDENVYGFVLLIFKPESKEVDLRMQVEPEWMPLFSAAAAKVVQAA